MNKYAALGLLLEAAEGKTVAVISRTQQVAGMALDQFEVPLGDGWRVRRTNGDQRIDSPSSGSIRFRSAGQSHRGWTVDVVYIDTDAAHLVIGEILHDLHLTLSSRPGACIVFA